MASDNQKAALILAGGMVISALIVLSAAHVASSRVSDALVKAGASARSHVAVPGFPSELKVQLAEPRPPLKTEDRERLKQAFIRAISQAATKDGRKVDQVVVTKLESPRGATYLTVEGIVKSGDPPEEIEFESYLYEDGFHDFTGWVRTKADGSGQRILLDNVTIR
jgi:hypothetical protein